VAIFNILSDSQYRLGGRYWITSSGRFWIRVKFALAFTAISSGVSTVQVVVITDVLDLQTEAQTIGERVYAEKPGILCGGCARTGKRGGLKRPRPPTPDRK
jgi:hypothetical protein